MIHLSTERTVDPPTTGAAIYVVPMNSIYLTLPKVYAVTQ